MGDYGRGLSAHVIHSSLSGARTSAQPPAAAPWPGSSCAGEWCQFETEKCQFETEKCQFETEKCQLETEKYQFETEKCQFNTEKCQFETEK